MSDRAEQLLAGPRGRLLCAELVDVAVTLELRSRTRDRRDRQAARTLLTGAVATADVPGLAADPRSLHDALVDSVDSAKYWQEVDCADEALAEPAVAELLQPVADAVVASPAAQWWWEPLDRSTQHHVHWLGGPDDDVLEPADPAVALRTWREETVEDEAFPRPDDPTAPVTGRWWSAPAAVSLLSTTRALPGAPVGRSGIAAALTPVGLSLVEDSFGERVARTRPLRVPGSARVYEVTGPASWAELAGRYPLEVSRSRRHDWWRVTGWDGDWVIPDWSAVAADFDAVHVTVAGYLSTAGRAVAVELPGPPTRTLLGGWDPDAAWWLTDVRAELGPPADWRADGDNPPRWEPAG